MDPQSILGMLSRLFLLLWKKCFLFALLARHSTLRSSSNQDESVKNLRRLSDRRAHRRRLLWLSGRGGLSSLGVLMASVNKVILVGHLGSDPEFRQTSGGLMTANVNIATSSRRKGRDGQYEEVPEWHRLVFFDKLAEVVRDCFRKGSLIFVEGRLQTRKWTDKQGIDRWRTEVIVSSMQLLDKKQDDGAAHRREEAPQQRQDQYQGGYEDVPF